MPNTKHIETITAFIAGQMDGDQVPPSNSAALKRLSEAVQSLHARASDKDWQILGIQALGAVIARTRSSLDAESTLHAFLRKGGNV